MTALRLLFPSLLVVLSFVTCTQAADQAADTNALWLRSGTDRNHGVAWFGSGKSFASTTPDGPVLFGYGGGALGRKRL